jgi:hypothetical protein
LVINFSTILKIQWKNKSLLGKVEFDHLIRIETPRGARVKFWKILRCTGFGFSILIPSFLAGKSRNMSRKIQSINYEENHSFLVQLSVVVKTV